MTRSATSLVPPGTARRALRESFTKLHPRHQLRNPVMFVVLVGSVFTLVFAGASFRRHRGESPWLILGVSAWLWLDGPVRRCAEAFRGAGGRPKPTPCGGPGPPCRPGASPIRPITSTSR